MTMEQTLRRAIDFEVRVREAFYTLSKKTREAMKSGERNNSDDLWVFAWNIAPKIFPAIDPKVAKQLTALAVDMPELMTREPENVQGLRFDYDLLPLTPLRVLHANVVELALRLTQEEIERLPRIGQLSGDCRQVYNWMQKMYVEGGFIAHGCVSVEGILRDVFSQTTMRLEKKARAWIEELIAQGFAERGDSTNEVYHLSLSERGALIARYHLATKWPTPYPASDEVESVQHALTLLSS